jgi:hypothetical protein
VSHPSTNHQPPQGQARKPLGVETAPLLQPPFSILHSPTSILRSPFSNLFLTILLLLALYAQMMGSVRVKSATYDEQTYYARGYAVLKTGDMRLRLRHPLLINLISAAPLLLLPDLKIPTDHGSWANAEFHEFSAQFVWATNREWADQIVYLSRWPMMLLTLVLAAFVYRWARALFGPSGALLALAVLAFDPNVIAHGRLANTDIGATAFIFIAAYAFWEYLRRPRWWRLLLAGVACGLAQATRFTALALLPIFGLEALLMVLQREKPGFSCDGTSPDRTSSKTWFRKWWRRLAQATGILSAITAISLLTIWAVYGFTWGPVDGTGPSLPAPDHWGEFLSLIHRLDRIDPAFLMGHIYGGGWWPYFFVVLGVKTPLPTLALIAWATVQMVRNRRLLRDAPFLLLLPAAAYFASGVLSSLNTGYRLILPILPFLAIHVARLGLPIVHFSRPCIVYFSPPWYSPAPRRQVPHLLILTLIAWLMLGTTLVYPHYLAYFNELVGPRNGYKVLVDSNLDWGQDLPGLRAWMDEHSVEQVYLSWFGIAPPEHYGVRYRYLPGWPPFEDPAPRVYHPQRPLPGMYAISATNLQGVLLDDPDTFAIFRAQQPIAQIGYSIFVYEVLPTGAPANLALGGPRLDQIPASTLDTHLATNDLRLRWFDPSTSLVLMPHGSPACYALDESHQLAEPLAARFFTGVKPLAEGAGLSLWPCPDDTAVDDQLAAVAAAPVIQSAELEFAPGDAPGVRLPVSLPASFDGHVAFLGYEYLTPSPVPGQEMALLTYWRVLKRPDHSLKTFVHLLDDHSQIWGQHDGLGVPVEGWYPGDVIVQLHTLPVSADAPPGRYWLEVGLYDPQTIDRLKAVDAAGAPIGNRLLLHEVRVQ